MRSLTAIPTTFVRNHQIKNWKKRHLNAKTNLATPVIGQHEPVFRANKTQAQQTKELTEFLNRFRDRS